jgi:G:T-mismatch repair DNA endonuclease (very short patch repair protein)
MRNQTRDKIVTSTLRAEGWIVVRVWEHELKKPNSFITRLRKSLTRGAFRKLRRSVVADARQ